MNSQIEEGSVFVNQKYGGETRTFSWKIAVSSVLVVLGVSSAIIYASAGYAGKSVPGLNYLKEFFEKSEERFFFVKNGNKLFSVSTENSTPVEHVIKNSDIEYLHFSIFCKYELIKLSKIVSIIKDSNTKKRRVLLYNYKTGESNVIDFDNNGGDVFYVSLSLNEDKIFLRTFIGETKFWIANIDGTDSKELEINSPIPFLQPQFALNDSVILYGTEKAENEYVIESFDLKTRDKKCFYNGTARIFNFLVSPDGNKIAVHTASKLQIIDLTNEKNKFGHDGKIEIEKLLKWSKDSLEVFYEDFGNNLWKLKLNPENGENQNEQVKDKTGNPIKLQILN